MKKLLHTAALAATFAAAFASAPAWAQTAAVKVEGAWARASVQGQRARAPSCASRPRTAPAWCVPSHPLQA